jgi:Mn-dependent DtxR family transcriptional regulator
MAQQGTFEKSPRKAVIPPRTAAEATEDYLETIDSLISEKGFAAPSDIADRMNVAKSSVTSIVKKLHKEGYVIHEPYRGLTLTESGRNLAVQMRRYHQTLARLLILLGIPPKIAREDAEKVEHGLHRQTIQKLQKLVKYLERDSALAEKIRTEVGES